MKTITVEAMLIIEVTDEQYTAIHATDDPCEGVENLLTTMLGAQAKSVTVFDAADEK